MSRAIDRRAFGLGLSAAAVSSLSSVSRSFAQTADIYPSRPVKLVVPYTPGGFPDTVARIVGQRLHAVTGQPFIVENRPGAGGTVAGEAVAKADPDGHTLLISDPSQWITPWIYKSLRYD